MLAPIRFLGHEDRRTVTSEQPVCLVAGLGLVSDLIEIALDQAGWNVTRWRPDSDEGFDASKLMIVDTAGVDDPLQCILDSAAADMNVLVVMDGGSAAALPTFLTSGATSILSQDDSVVDLGRAAALTDSGLAIMPREVAGLVLGEWRENRAAEMSGASVMTIPRLTPREEQILQGLVNGETSKAIARTLEISIRTVETHKANVFKKLGVRTQAQAVSLAVNSGLLDGGDQTDPR